MQGKNGWFLVPFQNDPLLSTPLTSCQRAFQVQLAKCLPVPARKYQNNVVSTTWKNASSPKHMSSPLFLVAAILFLLQHIWRRACLLSMMSHQPIFVFQVYICRSWKHGSLQCLSIFSLLQRFSYPIRDIRLWHYNKVILYLLDAPSKIERRNTDLPVYPFGDNATPTKKEDIFVCRYWLCGSWRSINGYNVYVILLINQYHRRQPKRRCDSFHPLRAYYAKGAMHYHISLLVAKERPQRIDTEKKYP